jgi:hypothetical protein
MVSEKTLDNILNSKSKIAILITTFLRDSLFYKTLQTIVDNYPDNSVVLIADQGYSSLEKLTNISYFKSQIPIEYYSIPFDSGLGFAKNFLVQKALELQIPYCLVMPDSIQFTESYNFYPLFIYLNNNILINFELEKIESINLKNIFIAKTDILISLWDDEMKIYEHELAFTEYITRGYKIVWNKDYNFKKIKNRSNKEYAIYCKRLEDYKKISIKKIKEK